MLSKQNSSFIDRMVEKLPEMHIWGYRYCGPNTKLERRLAHSESGINKLDSACKEHDIAYAESNDREFRCYADKLLTFKAIKRVFASDSRIGERFAALIVSGIISMKLFFVRIEVYIDQLRTCFKSKANQNSQ